MSPFLLSTFRYMIAGPILLILCAIFRVRMMPERREFALLALIGVLMLGIGNTSVMWTEQYLPSGLTALLVATIPLYAALIEMFLPNDGGLPLRGWVGVGTGFCGLIFLVWPGLRRGLGGDWRQLMAAGVVLTGAFCWTCASVLSRRTAMRISGFAVAGWEMLFGGLFVGSIMLGTRGYHGAQWGTKAAGAVFYLVVFGSLVSYSAYIYLLNNVAVSKVSTYAYVNPVIAVTLGAIFLGERFVAVEYAGMAAILLAVFLVTSAKLTAGKPTAVDEDVAAGGGA